MKSLTEIARRRMPPGVLILNLDDTILYANQHVMEMVPDLVNGVVPEGVIRLCDRMKNGVRAEKSGQEGDPDYPVLENAAGLPCTLRALFLGAPGNDAPPTHIMILVERIVERHEVDIDSAGKRFALSRRELDVLRLVCRGLGNRETAEMLFISEHTVKDHLKNIMKKMKASSRSEIVALLQ